MQYVGFDIGGTKCAVSVGEKSENGIKILGRKEIKTDKTVSAYVMIDRMCDSLRKLTSKADVIGISCGGPLDSKKGLILSPPNLPGWDRVEIVKYLEEKLKVKAFLENDANACAVAEWKLGAGRGYENMIFLTFGTGLGAGLILNGKLYRGASDMAGEVGHIRLADFGPVGYGKTGSFEGFCSGNGIAQIAAIKAMEKFQIGQDVSYCEDITTINQITAKSVAEFASKGFDDAIEVYKICGTMLGKGLSVLIDILNPEIIVLGSVFQRTEKLLRDAMEKSIGEECLLQSSSVCKIVPAELKDNIGDYAALSVAMLKSGKEE